MQARHLDHRRRHVDGADVRAVARERFGQQAAAAADVQHTPLRQRAALRQVVDAHRIEHVQRTESAARIPEFVRQGIELADFRVHRRRRGGAAHEAKYSRCNSGVETAFCAMISRLIFNVFNARRQVQE
jgi:hypothetical protein